MSIKRYNLDVLFAEDFAVEQLIAQLAVDQFALEVLSENVWFDIERLGTNTVEPATYNLRGHFRSVGHQGRTQSRRPRMAKLSILYTALRRTGRQELRPPELACMLIGRVRTPRTRYRSGYDSFVPLTLR